MKPFRTALFWTHLVTGAVAGVVIPLGPLRGGVHVGRGHGRGNPLLAHRHNGERTGRCRVQAAPARQRLRRLRHRLQSVGRGLSLTAANPTLAPETTRQVEAGTKWDLLCRRLSATAAVFRTEKRNARTPGVNPGDAPTVLAGRERVSGIEFGLSGRLRRWWTALANYAFMFSRITASNPSAKSK